MLASCREVRLWQAGRHSVRSNGHLAWTRRVEPVKYDLVAPDFAWEIFEDVDGQLLAGTTPVTKPKWRKPGVVTNRVACPIYDAEDRAESTIRNAGLAPIFYLEIGDLERTPRKAALPAFVFARSGAIRLCFVGLIYQIQAKCRSGQTQ